MLDWIVDFWNKHPIFTVLSGLFAFLPLASGIFRLLLQLSLKLISKLSGKAIEQQQLRDKIIDIVSRPLLALGNTLRFGLSFWFNKKVKYKARIIEKKITNTLSRRWIRLYEYDNGSYKNIITRKYFGTTIQEAEDLVRSWFIGCTPIKECTNNGFLLYFISNKLSDSAIDNIRNPKRDDLFGVINPEHTEL